MIKRLLYFFIFLNITVKVFAQTKTDTIDTKEAVKILKNADRNFAMHDYNAALAEYQLIEKFYKNDPVFNYNFGVCLLHESFDRKKGIGHLFIAANSGNIDAYRMIGWGCHLMYDFNEALKFYHLYTLKSDTTSKKYKNSGIKKMLEETRNAMEFVKNPVSVEIKNVGNKLNSAYPDYVPVITADDQEMYFTSRRETSTGGKKDHDKHFYEDIFHSIRDSITGEWGNVKHLHENLNSQGHDAIAGLSADGHTILIYRNDIETGFGDIFVSYLRGNDWTEPKKLGEDINLKESWEPSASLTSNEDALYFSSNRAGGYGGSDIYVAKRMPNGTWGEPKNLGPNINTEYDDDAPYIHPDSKTLYFSSKGHKNMGGFDIFKSEKNDSGFFQKAENIGYPINTTDDDIYFVITANGEHGYYASLGADSYGEKDIYMITFKPQEKALAVLKGRVSDLESEKSLSSMIFVSKLGSKKLNGFYNSNLQTGKYLIVMQPGITYQAVFTCEGYYSDTVVVDTKEINSFNQLEKNIKLRKKSSVIPDSVKTVKNEVIVIPKKEEQQKNQLIIETKQTIILDTLGKMQTIKNEVVSKEKENQKSPAVPQPISLETVPGKPKQETSKKMIKDCLLDLSDSSHTILVNFGYNLSTLTPEQFQALQSFIEPIKSKIIGIRINAHTDNRGSRKYNLVLSEKRAQSVANYLKQKGFAGKMLFACFYGMDKPLLPNTNPDGSDNPENRYKNRRCEIEFVVRE
jgi:outer membrane protein OmpA-like peptidoglycan-associated protein